MFKVNKKKWVVGIVKTEGGWKIDEGEEERDREKVRGWVPAHGINNVNIPQQNITLPICSSWFNLEKIHPIEKNALP